MKLYKYILLFGILLLLRPNLVMASSRAYAVTIKDANLTKFNNTGYQELLDKIEYLKNKSDSINSLFHFVDHLPTSWSADLKIALQNDILHQDNHLLKYAFHTADDTKKLQLAEAWKKIRTAIANQGGFTKHALDPDNLNKIAEIMQEGSNFRTKMNAMGKNWETELSIILNKNKSLKCANCGGGLATRPNLVDFLNDVDFYVQHYDINGTGNKFYRWIKRINVNETTMLGGENLPILEEMYQTLYHIRKKNLTNIVDFGNTFPQGTKQFDLFFGGGKYLEFKNVNFTNITSLSSQMINQVIDGYLRNITSLNDFDWVAYLPKLKANGWATKIIAESNLKALWKQAFIDNAEQMFKPISQGGLEQAKFEQLFGVDNVQEFLDDIVPNLDGNLYNFIKE